MEIWAALDTKDIFYCISGLILLSVISLPFFKTLQIISPPILLIVLGAVLYFTPVNLPLSEFQSDKFQSKVLEHFTEFAVIISLAGVGLSIDRRMGLKNWQHTWLLLIIVMPATILITFWLGYAGLGLSVASACLLGAVLAPTDPVLARSVQVDGPNKGEENDVNVSLTSEAGLNDGLAFPFIHLALGLAAAVQGVELLSPTLTQWFLFDLLYRIGMGVFMGVVCGYIVSWIYLKTSTEIDEDDFDFGVILLGSVFLTYGLTELFNGYGFLSVFVAAITGRMLIRRDGDDSLAALPHKFSDQVEKICIAFLLVWLGYHVFSGIMEGLRLNEIGIALALIFIVRPAVSFVSLVFCKNRFMDKFAISFLGIKGVGSLYYMAYAQNHGVFDEMDAVWRVTCLVIIISIFMHGITARAIMRRIKSDK